MSQGKEKPARSRGNDRPPDPAVLEARQDLHVRKRPVSGWQRDRFRPMNDATLYSAFAAGDARFDGIYYMGVTSTGIYCRPVCTARTPKASNCRFFESAEQAEKAKFRPCLRCRPELAPGHAPVDDARRISSLFVQRVDEGMLDAGGGMEGVAARFGWSSRQLRRMIHSELGVSPMELVLTRRLLLAKQLLTETSLPVSRVAAASGFASLRRFNDAFRGRYGMPPSRFRREADDGNDWSQASGDLVLQLGYRPPYDWQGVLHFLRARAMSGVEHVSEDSYSRTVVLGGRKGWVRVSNRPESHTLGVEIAGSLTAVIPALLGRLRQLFDLGARPEVIAESLGADPAIAELVSRRPGVRVPGAFDGFELAVRAILGQQVTVRAATTLAGRFAAAFGEAVDCPVAGLTHLTPTPERVAALRVEDLAELGIIRSRAGAILVLAGEVASGALKLESGVAPDEPIARLGAIPGVGAWTASYIAMRALRWPDAFLSGDVVVRKAMGGVSASRAEELSQRWRPWRSYAVLYLWGAQGAERTGAKAGAERSTKGGSVRRANRGIPGGAPGRWRAQGRPEGQLRDLPP